MVDIEEDDDIKGLEHRDRKEILKALDQGITTCVEKVKSGRIYNAENEKVRIRWIKALAYISDTFRKVKRDEDVRDLEERIEELEEG